MTTKRYKRLAALAAVPLIIALMAACSSGEPTAEDTDSKGSQSKITDSEDWGVAYASCMREQGIDMEDPKDGVMSSTTLSGDDADAFEAANESCIEEVGEMPLDPGQEELSDEEAYENQLKVAQCFRENGYDMPDPERDSKMALALPVDAPEDIIEECIGADMSSSNTTDLTDE